MAQRDRFEKCLEEWDYIGAMQSLEDPAWSDWLEKNAALELTPSVVTYINDDQVDKLTHLTACT